LTYKRQPKIPQNWEIKPSPVNEMFAFNSEWCRPWRSRVLWNIHRAESFKRPQLTRKLHTAYAWCVQASIAARKFT